MCFCARYIRSNRKTRCNSQNTLYWVYQHSQETTSSAISLKQAKISRARVPGGQSNLMYTEALNTTNPLENLPKTYIAKYISAEEHLTACSKQSGHKQIPLPHPSTFPLDGELSSNFKCHGIPACLAQCKQAAQATLHQQAYLLVRKTCKATQTLRVKHTE